MGYIKGYNFFLTNTVCICYTISENGSADGGYFDIVKWLRLLCVNNLRWFESNYRPPFLTVVVFLRFNMVP